MSRQSDAKKNRRKKRKAAQDSAWIPARVYQELVASDEDDPVTEAVADLDDWLTERGWVLDDGTTANLVSWVYPPSAGEFDDDSVEPVTRVWITVTENVDEVMLEFGAVLVGSGGGDDAYVLAPETLADDVPALEAYRPGLACPELA